MQHMRRPVVEASPQQLHVEPLVGGVAIEEFHRATVWINDRTEEQFVRLPVPDVEEEDLVSGNYLLFFVQHFGDLVQIHIARDEQRICDGPLLGVIGTHPRDGFGQCLVLVFDRVHRVEVGPPYPFIPSVQWNLHGSSVERHGPGKVPAERHILVGRGKSTDLRVRNAHLRIRGTDAEVVANDVLFRCGQYPAHLIDAIGFHKRFEASDLNSDRASCIWAALMAPLPAPDNCSLTQPPTATMISRRDSGCLCANRNAAQRQSWSRRHCVCISSITLSISVSASSIVGVEDFIGR